MGNRIVQLTGDWKKASALLHNLPQRFERAQKRVINAEARRLKDQIVETLETSGRASGAPFKPNKPATLKRKQGTRPLIDTETLLRGVTIRKVGRNVFVGIPSGKRPPPPKTKRRKGRSPRAFTAYDRLLGKKPSRGRSGASRRSAGGGGGRRRIDLASIARKHEFGYTITLQVTAKMLRFLHSQNLTGGGSGKGRLKVGSVLLIKVPARPFMRPSFKKLYGSRKEAERRMAFVMGLHMGRGWSRAVSPATISGVGL